MPRGGYAGWMRESEARRAVHVGVQDSVQERGAQERVAGFCDAAIQLLVRVAS